MPIPAQGFAHVRLTVTDIARSRAFFGLRPVAPGDDRFDEDRVGLDHVSFALPGRADIESARRPSTIGVAHGGIKDIGGALILEFRDPDNIALELFAPAS